MAAKSSAVLEAFASRLDALAERCRIRRFVLRPDGADAVILLGDHDGVPVTIRVAGVGKRQVRSTVIVDAPGIPVELRVRPELAGEGFDKALGMTVDAEVGDPEFDARFVVEAAPIEAARQLLIAPVRAALMAIPRDHELPLVALREGRLSLTWGGEPDAAMLAQAIEVLAQIRGRAGELREGLRDLAVGAVFRQTQGGERNVDPGEREAARTRLRSARTRVLVVIGSSAAAGLGFIVSVILGHAL